MIALRNYGRYFRVITRLFIIALFIFAVTIGFIYGYRKLAKDHAQHTMKIAVAGVITFAIIAGLSVLEGT